MVNINLTNDLPDAIRLNFIPTTNSSFRIPRRHRWLFPRQRHSLSLPDASGWLLGERLKWRAWLGVGEAMYIVRGGENCSSSTATVGHIAAPYVTPADDTDRFVLLVSAESVPLQICSEAPMTANTMCHGSLPPLGRRYLRGVSSGSLLEVYEVVWGEHWMPNRDGGRVRRRIATGVLPYRLADLAMVSQVREAQDKTTVVGRRLMSHLAQPALVCKLLAIAGGTDNETFNEALWSSNKALQFYLR